jgi:hypothetical protein
MRKLFLAFFTVAVALAGCSNGGGGSTDASAEASPESGTAGCTGDLDCSNVSDRCFFPVTGDCTQTGPVGTCMPYTAPASCTPTVACGCDGTTISVCAPDGYVDRPSSGLGACPATDGGDDASMDAGDAAADAAAE